MENSNMINNVCIQFWNGIRHKRCHGKERKFTGDMIVKLRRGRGWTNKMKLHINLAIKFVQLNFLQILFSRRKFVFHCAQPKITIKLRRQTDRMKLTRFLIKKKHVKYPQNEHIKFWPLSCHAQVCTVSFVPKSEDRLTLAYSSDWLQYAVSLSYYLFTSIIDIDLWLVLYDKVKMNVATNSAKDGFSWRWKMRDA